MSTTSAIDGALLAMLGADTTLLSYMTDGVYWANEAPAHAKKYVEVSLADNLDIWVFGQRAMENRLYLVHAVMLSSAGAKAAVVAAEARIDVLLDGQILGIGSPAAVAGYIYMEMAREREFHEVERVDPDKSLWWWRRGGYYRVQMAVIP